METPLVLVPLCAVQLDSIELPSGNPKRVERPLFGPLIPAGFPSPAQDFIEAGIDLNEFMIAHPSATFFMRVSGESMIEAGILDGDFLVVDRAIEPEHNTIVVAVVDGELTVKRLYKQSNGVELWPENEAYRPIKIASHSELLIWGVVVGVFRKTV